MSDTIESLLADDHASLGQLLRELDSALAGRDFTRSFDLLDLFWARLAVHIRAENLHLFPALVAAQPRCDGGDGLPASQQLEDVLASLRSDHDFFMKELARTIKVMREMIAGRKPRAGELEGLRQSILDLGKRLAAHNALEEAHVYKWPLLLFEPALLDKLCAQLRNELEHQPPRFA
jgi:Hemerythrin HHE cation binding domain